MSSSRRSLREHNGLLTPSDEAAFPRPSPTLVDPKHLLVLGAGPGLSASIARRFGREGFTVTLVARRARALAELAGQLGGEGLSVDTATADAADPHAFRTAMERLARRVAPGVVVYNAALITRDNILDIDEDDLLRTYAVNVLGTITAAQVFTRRCAKPALELSSPPAAPAASTRSRPTRRCRSAK